MTLILCETCGHRAKYHVGITGQSYSNPTLSCHFETDRYEMCTCDKLKVNSDEALLTLVKYDERQRS